MPTQREPAAASQLPDRSVWLVVFGVLELLVALGLVGLAGVATLGAALVRSGAIEGAPVIDARVLLPSLGFYVLLAAFFVTTGIGTIRKRRWARTLSLAASWLWLATGVLGFFLWLVMLRGVGTLSDSADGSLPDVLASPVLRVFLTSILAAVYVVIPVVFVLFFRSGSVRATVERHDTSVAWTDRVPAPVLSMVVTLVLGAVTCLVVAPMASAPRLRFRRARRRRRGRLDRLRRAPDLARVRLLPTEACGLVGGARAHHPRHRVVRPHGDPRRSQRTVDRRRHGGGFLRVHGRAGPGNGEPGVPDRLGGAFRDRARGVPAVHAPVLPRRHRPRRGGRRSAHGSSRRLAPAVRLPSPLRRA